MKTILLLISLIGAARAQERSNLGFEHPAADGRPAGWFVGGDGFEIVADSVAPFAGRFSLQTHWVDSVPYESRSGKFAVARQEFPVARAAGRRLHLSGYIRTENIRTGYAGLWMRVDGPARATLAFDNMSSRGPYGSTPWTRYDIELPVDSGAAQVFFGVLHPGDGTAWFDSLVVEVVGDPMPRRVTSYTPEPRPPEDMDRLLTDTELALPADTVNVPEDPEYTAWVRAHARPIRSLGATDFSDLRFLAPLLRDKRIVQLGESAHGVAEFNMAKVRLVKYLHEELGYDVMAFESSTYECERAQRGMSWLLAIELMRFCIFRVWHTSEVVLLFEYIKQTQSTTRPLILAGFDVQTSSSRGVRGRPGVFRSLIATLDSSYARRVYETDSAFLANPGPAYATAHQARLVAFYDSLAAFLRANRGAIEAAHRDDPNLALVARQAAVSMTFFVRQQGARPSRDRTEIRDLGMANNLDFLLEELYPGKKVIVWAHNFHIQHRENTGGSADTPSASPRTMGTWVAERHRSELYTIGLFMYRGRAAQNNRHPYPIVQSRSGSLESILHRAPWRYSFIDFSQARRERGSEWIWKPIIGLSWGRTPERFVPRDEYDGVLFIDKAHVPDYR
jgi:erythromycin esterase